MKRSASTSPRRPTPMWSARSSIARPPHTACAASMRSCTPQHCTSRTSARTAGRSSSTRTSPARSICSRRRRSRTCARSCSRAPRARSAARSCPRRANPLHGSPRTWRPCRRISMAQPRPQRKTCANCLHATGNCLVSCCARRVSFRRRTITSNAATVTPTRISRRMSFSIAASMLRTSSMRIYSQSTKRTRSVFANTSSRRPRRSRERISPSYGATRRPSSRAASPATPMPTPALTGKCCRRSIASTTMRAHDAS